MNAVLSSVAGSKPLGRNAVVYATLLLTFINILNYVDRMVLAVLVQPIKLELRLSDSEIGLLTGFAFVAIYGVVSLPLAQQADRIGRRWVLTGAVAVWSLMTAASGLTRSFWQLGLMRVGVGVGEAGCMPSSHALIAEIYPQGRRTVPVAIVTSGAAIGIALGLSLGGLVAAAYGWRAAFVIAGLPGLLVALLVATTLPDPAHRGRAALAPARLWSRAPALFRLRTYRWTVCAHPFYQFVTAGLLGWLPSFYMRSHAMTLREVGPFFGITYGLGVAVGGLLGGLILQRLTTKSPARILFFGGWVVLSSFPFLFAALIVPSAGISLVMITIFGALAGGGGSPMIAGQQGVVGDDSRALASALSLMIASYLGGGLGPLLVGVCSEGLAGWLGAASLRASLLIASFAVILPGVFMIKASKSFAEEAVY